MPAHNLLPDVEALLTAALLADTTLAAFVTNRIATDLPKTFTGEKRLKVTRAGGAPVDADTEHVDRAVVQVEAFGATKAEAFDTAALTLRTMLDMAGGSYARGVVGRVERLSGPTWAPDPETFIPRYLLSVAVHVHAPMP